MIKAGRESVLASAQTTWSRLRVSVAFIEILYVIVEGCIQKTFALKYCYKQPSKFNNMATVICFFYKGLSGIQTARRSIKKIKEMGSFGGVPVIYSQGSSNCEFEFLQGKFSRVQLF